MKISKCKGCRAEVIFAVTRNGCTSPFDADPSPVGAYDLRVTSEFGQPSAVFVPKPVRRAAEILYVSHFATCPRREDFK